MKTKEFEALCLNMHDVLKMKLVNFYYKITKTPGQKTVEYGYDKGNEKGWIYCTDLLGAYCGELTKPNGELHQIQIRVFEPFKMGKTYRNYLSIDASAIVSIEITSRQNRTILDEICHELAIEKKEIFELV